MAEMSPVQIDEYLAEPYVAVLSVSRHERGPVAVPVWYLFQDRKFLIITSPTSLHGLLQRERRATVTIRSEDYAEAQIRERYVMAEGPIGFIDDEIQPVNRGMRRKYLTGSRLEEWVNRPPTPDELAQKIAVLRPEILSGYEWHEKL